MTQSYFWGHNWLFEQKLMCTKYFTVLKEKKAILKFISAYSIQFTLWHFAMDDLVPLDDGTLAFMGWASFHWDGLAFYRVSHSKEGKVILLCWCYRFWFLLIFWVIRVNEMDSLKPISSVFIFFDVARPPQLPRAKINKIVDFWWSIPH